MPRTTSRASAIGLLLAGCGAILFASKGLFSKSLNAGGVDAVTLTTLRALLALPMFMALAVWRGMSLRRAPKPAIARAAFAGMLCYGAGALIDFHALELIDISLERALLFTYPALVVAWHALRRRRSPAPATLLALALTYIGIVLVVGAFDTALWRQNLLGAGLVMLCAATTAAYFLLGERCIPDLGSSGFTIIAMSAAALLVTVFFLITHPLSDIAALTRGQWLLVLGLSVLCMFLPTLCQAEAIKRIGAERGSLAGTIGPPAALFLGMILLDERPGSWQLVGTMLIIAGIVLIARRGNPGR
jgi:drug/metabolite transporter (DMT)-like permease